VNPEMGNAKEFLTNKLFAVFAT